MSENTNLDNVFKELLDNDPVRAKRLIEKYSGLIVDSELVDEEQVNNNLNVRQNFSNINAREVENSEVERFSYEDGSLDSERATRLRNKLGKIPLSTIYSVFILDCLQTLKRGRKKSTILELLNAGGLPIAKNTLTTKMNRLKLNGYISWTNGLRPGEPEIKVEEQGIMFLEDQLSDGLRGLELTAYQDAKQKAAQMLAGNS